MSNKISINANECTDSLPDVRNRCSKWSLTTFRYRVRHILSQSFNLIFVTYLTHIQGIHVGSRTRFYPRYLITETHKGPIRIGERCQIRAAMLRGRLDIGDDVFVNHGCNLLGGGAAVIIGNDVLLAPNVTIVSEMHRYDDPGIPIRVQGFVTDPIVVENDVWIGANAVVLPGVHIGQGAVVGANAVLSQDVAPYAVVGGVPARFIKRRERSEDPEYPPIRLNI
jgi:acetyltransferase-like isoleucine patch superfamily enzyme